MELSRFSTPSIAQKRANQYLGKKVSLLRSSRTQKKYMIQDPSGKWVHFGQMGYEDYTKHKNKTRRKNYLTRSGRIRGNWAADKYSANNLSRKLLW